MSDLLVSIRHAKPGDAAALSKVFDTAWREAYLGIIPGVTLDRMFARRGERWWRSTVIRRQYCGPTTWRNMSARPVCSPNGTAPR